MGKLCKAWYPNQQADCSPPVPFTLCLAHHSSACIHTIMFQECRVHNEFQGLPPALRLLHQLPFLCIHLSICTHVLNVWHSELLWNKFQKIKMKSTTPIYDHVMKWLPQLAFLESYHSMQCLQLLFLGQPHNPAPSIQNSQEKPHKIIPGPQWTQGHQHKQTHQPGK